MSQQDLDEARADAEQTRKLPFHAWWPIAAGAFAGVALRLVFRGHNGQQFSAMLGVFIYLAPVLVAAVTVYLAERQERRSWYYYFWAGAVANLFFVLGTLAIMIEGLICAVVIVPLFSFFGGLAGLFIGACCRWTEHPRKTLYSIAVLPLLFGALEPNWPLPDRFGTIERSLIVDAAPKQIWRFVESADAIQPGEVSSAWMYRIGVPLPESGLIDFTADQPVRHVKMGKGIHFDQVAVAFERYRRVKWTYRFAPDSFPAYALDDHVRIGGDFFDLADTEYRLTPIGEKTRLDIHMSYRVSTRFNWYAEPVARFLIGNFEEVILNFYAQRALRSEQFTQR